MMRMRIPLACLLIVLVCTLPASAEEGSACAGERVVVSDGPMPVCGVIDIEASESRSLLIRVDEATSLELETGGVDVVSEGKLAFLTISNADDSPLLAVADMPRIYPPGDAAARILPTTSAVVAFDPGEYRVNLVVIGGPAKARLRFTGELGGATYLPSVHANVITEEPEVTMGGGSSPAVWGGGEHVLPSDGLAFYAIWARGPAPFASQAATCDYVDDTSAPPQVAFAPGPACVALGGDWFPTSGIGPVDHNLDHEYVGGMYGPSLGMLGGMKIGIGGNLTSAIPPTSAGVAALWLGFDPAE